MPHRRKAARPDAKADTQATAVAESGKRRLSESNPKAEEEMMPGALKRVRSKVAEEAERAIFWA